VGVHTGAADCGMGLIGRSEPLTDFVRSRAQWQTGVGREVMRSYLWLGPL